MTKLDASAIETVLLRGDLSKLTEPQRLAYYTRLCETVGLNPLTQPFQYLNLSGKLVLYARKDCTDQLRSIHGVSVEKLEHRSEDGLFIVTANVRDVKGRCDAAIGATHIENLKGEAKANAMMKAETKAKRRATLSICGLGMLDETEIDSIPGAMPVQAIAPDGLVGPKCEDCGNAYSDWAGEIDGRKMKYNITQLQVISRKLYELDVCGDCLLKRKNKRLTAAEAGQPDPTLAPSASTMAEPEKPRGRKKSSKQTDFNPEEFEITDQDTEFDPAECMSPQISFK